MIYNVVYWVQVVSLSYVTVSAPLYIFVMLTIMYYRNKEEHLRNSFFHLWMALGMADLSHAAVFWFSSKIPLMGFIDHFFLSAGRKFATVIMYLMFVTHFSQVLGIVNLSLNRLTALVYPTKSEQVRCTIFM